MSSYEDPNGPNIRVPLLFSIKVGLILVALTVLLGIQGLGEDPDRVEWPHAWFTLPAAAIILLFGWRAVSETEPLDEPGDWALPIAATLLLVAVACVLALAGAGWLGVLLVLCGPFAAAAVASLRGPASRVFVVVAAGTASALLLLASL
jgi:hypothetical protein